MADEPQDIKKEIEAILFAAGRKVELDEIAKLCKMDKSKVKETLEELKKEYDSGKSPLLLIQDGEGWKLTVRERYLPLVKDINPHTELNRALLETLAIIAWKQPVMQADVIKIRGSKGYEHVRDLVEMGFITKTKLGRSYTLRPSTRFFDYFDLPSKEAVKEIFKDVELKDSQRREEMQKNGDGKIGQLEVYDAKPDEEKEKEAKEAEEDMETEKFGKLEVFEEKQEKQEEESEEAETGEEKEEEEKSDENGSESKTEEYSEDQIEKIEKDFEEEEKADDDKENPQMSYESEKSGKRKLSKELEDFGDIQEEDKEEDDK